MHREQLRRFGRFRTRTLANSNDFFDKGEYYEMVIYNNKSEERARAFVDKDDKPLVEKVGSWCMDRGGYVMNGSVKTAMHRFLLGKKKGLEIDHINGNKLDNRRSNLRFVTHRENGKNWIQNFKRQVIKDYVAHLASGKSVEEFFATL